MAYCSHCGSELVKNARFCSHCGTQTSLKNKIAGLSKRFRHKTKNTLENIKASVDTQISQYLERFDRGEDVTIAGINIPDNRREGVRRAMTNFQNKYFESEPQQTADYEEWINSLSQRLEEQNCVVCFAKWDSNSEEDIVVCPECQSGGHKSHLKSWIKSKNYCPLCRSQVKFADYIKIV